MDWCVDPQVPGAFEATSRSIEQHLARRGIAAADARAALRQARDELDHFTDNEPFVLRLCWEADVAVLAVFKLRADRQMPGTRLAPGATTCLPSAEGRRSSSPVALGRIDLALSRLRHPLLDADPGGESLPAKRDGFLAGVAAIASRASSYGPEGCAALAGAASSREAERLFRDGGGHSGALDARQVAEAFVSFQRAIGGDFEVLEADATKATVANRTCPFGEAVRSAPHLCQVTAAMLGSMGARSSGRAEVNLDQRIAIGDDCCQLSLDLSPEDESSSVYTSPPAGIPAQLGRSEALGELEGHGISLSVQLPRDRMSAPVIRHLAHYALAEVGVTEEVIFDIELALSEACTNVLSHSGPGDAYEVTISIRGGKCELRIRDTGRGFDHVTIRHHSAGLDAERGRGMALMQQVMDRVDFVSEPERGTLVRLTKELTFDEDSPARVLLAAERRKRGAG